MKNIDVIKQINKNKDGISNINYELSKTENTKYTTANGIKEFSCKDGYIDNIAIEGETLVNLCHYPNKRNESSNRYFQIFDNRITGSDTYTIIIPNIVEGKDVGFEVYDANGRATNYGFVVLSHAGFRTVTIPKDHRIATIHCQKTDYTEKELKMLCETSIILKGDHTDKPISYFEGLKSVGQGDKIEVLSYNGKNFDYGSLSFTNGIKLPTSGVHTDNDDWKYSNYIKVNPNTDYLLKYVSINVNFYDINKNIIPSDYQEFLVENVGDISIGHVYIKTPSNCEYIIIHRRHINTTPIEMYTISLYDKKQISTTLRSLPNGVKDTIEKRGNKYVKVQRCGEVILNGSEIDFVIAKGSANYTYARIGISDIANTVINLYCDKFSPNDTSSFEREMVFGEGQSSIGRYIYINILNSRLTSQSVDGFRTWLKSNPVTVVYELATPIITELPNFNPQTFEGDTTLLINSGVIQANADFEVTNSLGSEIEVLKGKVSSLDDYVVDEEVYHPTLLNGFSQVHFNDNNFIKKIGNMCFMNLVFKNTSSVQDGTLICKLPLNFKSKNVTRVVSIGSILNANVDINENNILIYPSSENISNVPFRVNCCWEVE